MVSWFELQLRWVGVHSGSADSDKSLVPDHPLPMLVTEEVNRCSIVQIILYLVRVLTPIRGMMGDYQIYDIVLWRQHSLQRAEVRSEEHTSELQSLMRISYAVFCLKKNKEKST